MPVAIEQKPLYGTNTAPNFGAAPVGQQLIFTISDGGVGYLTSHFNVKFLAELHVSTTPINLSNLDNLVATFKTTPNNAGVGIFDFKAVLESFVKSDNRGFTNGVVSSTYKTKTYDEVPHPIHIIDKFSRSGDAVRYFAIQFKAEGALTATDPVSVISGSATNTDLFTFFNGVLQRENYLTLSNDNYGYDLESARLYTAKIPGDTNNKFLTNAPTTQYANVNDYGTFAFLNFLPVSTDKVTSVKITYYPEPDAGGSLTGTDTITNIVANGGAGVIDGSTSNLQYFGIFPGNLQNISTNFSTTTTESYTVQAFNSSTALTDSYIINVNCPTLKGYESIRLCWLNQWGVWDYYTFKMKSVRSTSTNKTTYTQMSGTWNDSTFKIDGYKGGRKNFRVNATERITINTDFINEAEAVWFEELINSPEVYILNGYDSTETTPYNTITNKYVEPVLLTTSNYIRKTIANDKLMQYTFELERNKTQQTQTA
jgi:hypothetical protein